MLIGEHSNNIDAVAGTNGQILIATPTDPVFGYFSSSLGTMAFTSGPGLLNADISIPLLPSSGGTGATNYGGTTSSVLYFDPNHDKLVSVGAGTTGQFLVSQGITIAPQFQTISAPDFISIIDNFGTTVTSAAFKILGSTAPGFPIFTQFTGTSLFIDMPANTVPYGGTGQTTLTTYGILIGEGSNNIDVTAAGMSGQILMGTPTDPVFSYISSTAGTLAMTAGPGQLNLDLTVVSPRFGGTDRTVLTSFGVLIGEGTNPVHAAVGTNGQLLLGTPTDPVFAYLSSSAGTLTFIVGPGSLNIDVAALIPLLSVGSGGTSRTVLTTYGVLLGEGSNGIHTTAAGTNGQILIGTSTDPVFGYLTSSSGTLTYVFGPGTVNIEVSTVISLLPVQHGGTGQTVLTTFGVLLGEGSNNVHTTAVGTNGQILIGTPTDPVFALITSSNNTIAITAGPGLLNFDQMNFLSVPLGGTGRSVLTSFGVLLGEGSNALNAAVGTNGQILIGTPTDPIFGNLTSSASTFAITFGPGQLNVDLLPIAVAMGGTGRTALTSFGVLIGEGSGNVHAAVGTNGQILLGTATDPVFALITSSAGTIVFTAGPGTLNADLATPVSVPFGGTARTALTSFGILLGEGSGAIHVTAAGTNGQVLIGTPTDPVFGYISSSGATLGLTAGPGLLNIDVIAPFPVAFAGTGRTVLTTFGVLLGEGSNGVHVTAAGTNGQVLIGSPTDPVFANITSSAGSLTLTAGPGVLNIDLAVSGLPVGSGGTGRTALTTFGVLLGEGSNGVHVTAAGTNGQVLIGSPTDPVFASISSSGGTISLTAGPGLLNLDLTAPVSVPFGGTGRTALTSFGVLLGEGSGSVHVTAAGTNGQVLIGSPTDPVFASISSSAGTMALTAGPGLLNIDLTAPVSVPFGGTGRTVLTSFGVLLGEGSGSIHVTAAGTNGQVLIGSPTDPIFGSITSSSGTVSITAGPGQLNFDIMPPFSVPFGGTGRSVLTTFGVLLGEGSGNIHVTAAGTNGQVLLGSPTDPVFGTISSSSGTFTLIAGPGLLNVDLTAPISVPFGGTGRTVLTSFGVLLGEGSGSTHVTAAGTNGQVLIGSPTDPVFGSITSSSGTISIIAGPGQLNFDVTAPLSVPFGGTGRTVLTSFGVLLGEGSGNIHVTAAGTNGQVLIGSPTDPVFASLTSSANTFILTSGPGQLNVDLKAPISIAFGGTNTTTFGSTISSVVYFDGNKLNTITAGSSGTVLKSTGFGTPPSFQSIEAWTSISASQALVSNNGYIVTAGALSLSLPLTSAVGDIIEVALSTGTSWSITESGSQQIRFGDEQTTAGTGSLTSTASGDAVRMVCDVANTHWEVLTSMGNLTII